MRDWIVWVQDLRSDLRHAARALTRRPTLTAVAVITVALGSGAASAVLNLHQGFLARPLAVADQEGLRVIDESRVGATSSPVGINAVPWERFESYRVALDDVFSGFGAERLSNFSLSGDGGAVAVTGYLVSGSYFDVLGAPPVLGRYFSTDDAPAVVVGHRLWRTHFGGDPDVVGQTARVGSRPYTIVAVAPEGFRGTLHGLDAQLWVPLRAHRAEGPSGFESWVTFFGRLRPGVSEPLARERVNLTATSIPPLQSQTTVRGAVLAPMTGLPPQVQPVLARFLALLVATGGLVLIIAGANIAGILVALAVARRSEMAVRMALGASRRRLVRHVLLETLLLFGMGAVAGLAVGALASAVLQGIPLQMNLDVAFDLSPGPMAMTTSVLSALLVGVMFGLVPAWQASRADIGSTLKAMARGQSRTPLGWRWFVGVQISLAVVLLIAGGLFTRSVLSGGALDPGFEPDGVVIGKVALTPHTYDLEAAQVFFQELLDRVRAMPDVESAALAETVPLGATYGRSSGDVRPLYPVGDADVRFNAAYTRVGVGYFQSIGTELVAGRGFTSADRPEDPRVAVVNETFVTRSWGPANPIGKRFRQNGREYEVVGVARDGKYGFIGEEPTPYVFLSASQEPQQAMTIHTRSARPAGEALALLRGAVQGLDPDVPLQGGVALADLVDLTLFPQRLGAGFIGVFGLVGLLFAGVGIYGLIAFHAAQRTHEIGIRMALGAHPSRLVRQMTWESVRLAAVWVLVGLGAGGAVGYLIRSLMIDVAPLDPLTFGVVALCVLTVATVASFLPSLRASSVDPASALRDSG